MGAVAGVAVSNRFSRVYLWFVVSINIFCYSTALMGAHDAAFPRAAVGGRLWHRCTGGITACKHIFRIKPYFVVSTDVFCCLQHCWAHMMLAFQPQLLAGEYCIGAELISPNQTVSCCITERFVGYSL